MTADDDARRRMLARDRSARLHDMSCPPDPFAVSALAVREASNTERATEALRHLLTVDPESAARFRRLVEGMADAFASIEESLRPAAAAAGLSIGEYLDAWRRSIERSSPMRGPFAPLLPRPEVVEDPREHALAARRARGTGPDRQVQHRRRPRRLP